MKKNLNWIASELLIFIKIAYISTQGKIVVRVTIKSVTSLSRLF